MLKSSFSHFIYMYIRRWRRKTSTVLCNHFESSVWFRKVIQSDYNSSKNVELCTSASVDQYARVFSLHQYLVLQSLFSDNRAQISEHLDKYKAAQVKPVFQTFYKQEYMGSTPVTRNVRFTLSWHSISKNTWAPHQLHVMLDSHFHDFL